MGKMSLDTTLGRCIDLNGRFHLNRAMPAIARVDSQRAAQRSVA